MSNSNDYRSDRVAEYMESLAAMDLLVQSPHTLDYAFNRFYFKQLTESQFYNLVYTDNKRTIKGRYEKWKSFVSQLQQEQ